MAEESGGGAGPEILGWVPKLGVWAWSLVGFVVAMVMGRTLDIHLLVVLVVTALGGLLGGIVGLILAVPATVIASNAIARLRSRGSLARVAERAEPTVRPHPQLSRRRLTP